MSEERVLHKMKQGFERTLDGPTVTCDDEMVALLFDREDLKDVVRDFGGRGFEKLRADLRACAAGRKFATPAEMLQEAEEREVEEVVKFRQENGVAVTAFVKKVDA